MPIFGPSAVTGAPLPSLTGPLDGGVTIPKRSMDRWTMGSKPARTALNGAITNVQNTITVRPVPANGAACNNFLTVPVTYRIIIDNEIMLVTGGQGTLVWNVTRGANGTAAVAHADAATVLGDAVTHVMFAGDSTVESSVGATDEWPQRFGRMLGRTLGGGYLGRGIYPFYRSDNSASFTPTAFNSAAEYTAAGAWTLRNDGTLSDVGPFGWAITGNGAATTVTYTRSADVLAAQVDLLIASGNCSYSVNGGAFVDAQGGFGKRIPITAAVNTLTVRCATAAGVATTPVLLALDVWAVAPTFGVTQGVKTYNLGKDADFLDVFCRANAGGDDFALYDGHDYSVVPDLCIVGSFTNDVLYYGADPTMHNYAANLTTVVNRVKPYADVILMAYCEQDPTIRPSAAQAVLRGLVHQVADATQCACLDVYQAFAAEGVVGYPAALAEGLMSSGTHLSQLGDNEVSARLMRMCSLTTL